MNVRLRSMLVKIQYRRRNHFWDTQYIVLESPDLEFSLFSYQLPDSLLKSFKCISDLKVICAQSWGDIEALWALRSAKVSSQQPSSSVHFAGNTL